MISNPTEIYFVLKSRDHVSKYKSKMPGARQICEGALLHPIYYKNPIQCRYKIVELRIIIAHNCLGAYTNSFLQFWCI